MYKNPNIISLTLRELSIDSSFKFYFVLIAFVLSGHSEYKACHNASFTLDSSVVDGPNCRLYMTICAEGGFDGSDGSSNTGGFGFVLFGGTVVNYTPVVTSDSMAAIYSGDDYYNTGLEQLVINAIFPAATGFIGYQDATPPPPPPNFDWFLCRDDPACGVSHVDCKQIVMTTSVVPDSIRLAGLEGAFDAVQDLISALAGNTGCPGMTIYPLPCGIPLPINWSDLSAVQFMDEIILEGKFKSNSTMPTVRLLRRVDGMDTYMDHRLISLIDEGDEISVLLVDPLPLPGNNFYQIVQQYDNGEQIKSPWISANFSRKKITELTMNIVSNEYFLEVSGQSYDDKEVRVSLLNLSGQEINNFSIDVLSDSFFKIQVDRAKISPGFYFIRVGNRESEILQKVVLY